MSKLIVRTDIEVHQYLRVLKAGELKELLELRLKSDERRAEIGLQEVRSLWLHFDGKEP